MRAHDARVRLFQSRWASCDARNVLEFHPRVMELPTRVQDYIIVHELCHTVEKSHTKAFWALVARHMPDWQRQRIANEWRIWRRDLSQEVFAGNRRHRAGDVDNEDADLHPTE